jgi:hypothetical protein
VIYSSIELVAPEEVSRPAGLCISRIKSTVTRPADIGPEQVHHIGLLPDGRLLGFAHSCSVIAVAYGPHRGYPARHPEVFPKCGKERLPERSLLEELARATRWVGWHRGLGSRSQSHAMPAGQPRRGRYEPDTEREDDSYMQHTGNLCSERASDQ